MDEQKFNDALKEAETTIKNAIIKLKATAADLDTEDLQKALAVCLPGCIKCNSSCIARSACDTFACANNCINWDTL